MTNARTRHKRIPVILAACAAALIALLPSAATVQDGQKWSTDLSAEADALESQHPKLDGALNRVHDIYRTRGIAEAKEDVIQRKMIDMEGDLVRVVAVGLSRGRHDDSLIAARLKTEIPVFGGRVETSHRNLVQCLLPINALAAVADLPDIKLLRQPFKPIPLEVSQGVAKTGADQWHSVAPYRTSGDAKVCILDLGFKGYQSLVSSGELPSDVTARSFRSDGKIDGSGSGSVHGAACAEIVHDMAPDAKLYLVNFGTDVEHHNAVDWIVDQEVDVVSYSVGWTNAGDGKGTGPINEDVEAAAAAGITWVGAAGNYAEDHWEGTFSDTDGDKWHNFKPGDEILNWYVPAYYYVAAFLSWDDFGTWDGSDYSGSAQNYDLYLYIWNGSAWQYVAKSSYVQNGDDWPIEAIGYWYSSSATNWGIAIRKVSATRNVKFDLFTVGNTAAIEYNVPWGSLCSPADSSDSVTVGATDWETDAYHAYSSRGPTNDNRTKPDFSAPAGVRTVSYGSGGFYGTSASTPHVAGAFGLLKGKLPFTLAQINTILQARAVDLGTAGKDNQFGVGRINLKK